MMTSKDEEKTIQMNKFTEEHSRSDKRKQRKRGKESEVSKRPSVLKSPRPKRKFPIWARIIVVLALIALSLFAGLMFGYGIIGDGNPTDALNWETFQHIFDLINKE
jgi:uncharacterized membrane protein YvbJ